MKEKLLLALQCEYLPLTWCFSTLLLTLFYGIFTREGFLENKWRILRKFCIFFKSFFKLKKKKKI